MKKFLSVVLTVVFLLGMAVPVPAADAPSLKKEAVYGILDTDGSVRNIYVVNSFKGGIITDYGRYSAVRNLTSAEKLARQGDKISVDTVADRFYYQGELKDKGLPWNLAVNYTLDGEKVCGTELAGRSGALEINMSVTENKAADPLFYENYMLQISLTLDSEECTDIRSPHAMVAEAGKNTVVTHTVMPGKGADIRLRAQVRDFAMPGIEITALPPSMLLDTPDVDRLTGEMAGLAQAVGSLNDGIEKLSDGTAATHAGARQLTEGSADFANGLGQLSGASDELLGASGQINTALAGLAGSLTGVGDFDFGAQLAMFPKVLRQLADGLDEVAANLSDAGGGYAAAYAALDAEITRVPNEDLDPSALYLAAQGSAEMKATLDQLMVYYEAAQTVRDTYAGVQEVFISVEADLDFITRSIRSFQEMLRGMADEIEQSAQLTDIAGEAQQLIDGIAGLAQNYSRLHDGFTEYVRGVETLAAGYGRIHKGADSLADGIGALNTGATELSRGAGSLNEAVAGLPDHMRLEVDELMGQYDKSDFDAISFVSDKNTNVTAVQFILRTEPIGTTEPHDSDTPPRVQLTLWQKLLKLFGL